MSFSLCVGPQRDFSAAATFLSLCSAAIRGSTALSSAISPRAFTASDSDGDNFTISFASTNTSLVPEDKHNIVITEGTPPDYTLDIIPATDEYGYSDISLIVTDVRMPTLSGIELSQEVKERYPKIHIMLITGLELSYFSEEDLKSSAELLNKDIGCEGILKEIKKFFDGQG